MNQFRLLQNQGGLDQKYHLRIFALGYESRSRYIFENQRKGSELSVAFGFDKDQSIAWQENENSFRSDGAEVVILSDSEFRQGVKDYLETKISLLSGEIKVFVDISSFSRFRLACIIEILASILPLETKVVFGYSVARFVPPQSDEVPITKVAPVTGYFAGIPTDPEDRLIAILGLGYDQDRALGAIEYLEIGETWLFRPVGKDSRYDSALVEANTWLLDSSSDSTLEYKIDCPLRTYTTLASLAQSCLVEGRPLIIPFGPKLFALLTLILAQNNYPHIAVWHVSSVEDRPVDRAADFSVGIKTEIVNPDLNR